MVKSLIYRVTKLQITIFQMILWKFLEIYLPVARNSEFFKKHIILEATYISSFQYTLYEIKEDSVLNATSEHRYCPL